AQGRGVRLLVRSLNYYWVGQGDPPAPDLQIERAIDRAPLAHVAEPVVTFGQRIARLTRTLTPAKPAPPRQPATSSPPPAKTTASPLRDHYAKVAGRKRKRAYWK